MKKRNATHFVEQYNSVNETRFYFSGVTPIKELNRLLHETQAMKTLKTVAIFYIFLKKQKQKL